jgi:predicted glutamine amidotransferase
MCRFAAYLGEEIAIDSLVTLPANSIIHQSHHSHERVEPLNGEVFWLAWYADWRADAPAIFRSVTPAWNNQNLLNIARVTKSRCVFAHVRAASPGLPVTELNCHPFAWGPLAFMHNGFIGDFQRIRRALTARLSETAYAAVKGSTDSEHLFGLFIDHWRGLADEADPAERLAAAMQATITQAAALAAAAGVDAMSLLNLAVTDGERAVVSRYTNRPAEPANSLYVHTGQRYVCEGDVCRMVGGERGAVMVCSEPLSQGPGWRPVPVNHLVVVDADLAVTLRPLR